jgi:hypothetical protein
MRPPRHAEAAGADGCPLWQDPRGMGCRGRALGLLLRVGERSSLRHLQWNARDTGRRSLVHASDRRLRARLRRGFGLYTSRVRLPRHEDQGRGARRPGSDPDLGARRGLARAPVRGDPDAKTRSAVRLRGGSARRLREGAGLRRRGRRRCTAARVRAAGRSLRSRSRRNPLRHCHSDRRRRSSRWPDTSRRFERVSRLSRAKRRRRAPGSSC